MKRAWLSSLGMSLLVACGPSGQSADAPSGEEPAPVVASDPASLQIRLLAPVPGLTEALADFADEHGVEVRIITDPAPALGAAGDVVREVRTSQLADLANAQVLRALPPTMAAGLTARFVNASRMGERRWYGITWRAELFGLLVRNGRLGAFADPASRSWSGLTRLLRDAGWGVATDVDLLNLYRPLHHAAGADFLTDGEVVLRTPEAEEALAFLHNLARLATRGSREDLAREWRDGAVDILWTDLGLASRLAGEDGPTPHWVAFPPLEPGQRSYLMSVSTSLARPVGGAHGDLADLVIQRLLAADIAALLANDGAVIPCSRAWATAPPGSFLEQVQLSRDDVTWVPPFPQGERACELIRHAVDQAITNKRSPQDALLDAQTSFMTHAFN